MVANTWFTKEDSKKVTYESGGNRSVVDYVLMRQCQHSMVSDVTVVNGEACIPQHKLLLCKVEWGECVKRRKAVYVNRCRVWKLKEGENCIAFKEKVEADLAVVGNEEDMESDWCSLKNCLLANAEEVCGMTKGPSRHKTSWWWNDEVKDAVKKKKVAFQSWKKAVKGGGVDRKMVEELRKAYYLVNKESKKAVYKAQSEHTKRLGDMLDEGDAKGNVFKVAKRMIQDNKDIVGGGAIKDSNGELVVDSSKVKDIWSEYYEKLLNEEFDWSRDNLEEVEPVS